MGRLIYIRTASLVSIHFISMENTSADRLAAAASKVLSYEHDASHIDPIAKQGLTWCCKLVSAFFCSPFADRNSFCSSDILCLLCCLPDSYLFMQLVFIHAAQSVLLPSPSIIYMAPRLNTIHLRGSRFKIHSVQRMKGDFQTHLSVRWEKAAYSSSRCCRQPSVS